MYFGNYLNYPIYLAPKSSVKKYYATVNNKRVYFGSKFHEQYFDQIGYYKALNHNDKERRKRYYLRHNVNYPRGSADWFSKKLLW